MVGLLRSAFLIIEGIIQRWAVMGQGRYACGYISHDTKFTGHPGEAHAASHGLRASWDLPKYLL